MFSFQALFGTWSTYMAQDAAVRSMQIWLLTAGVVLIFLLFYATRDILLRSRSFWYQLFSILLVAALPGVGFLLYMLIRPSRTLKERAMESLLRELVSKQHAHHGQKHQHPHHHQHQHKKPQTEKTPS